MTKINTIDFCEIKMHVDDHHLYCLEKIPKLVERQLSHDIKSVTQWYSQNQFLVNKEKYQTVVIGPTKAIDTKMVDGEEDIPTKQLRLLGEIIDD